VEGFELGCKIARIGQLIAGGLDVAEIACPLCVPGRSHRRRVPPQVLDGTEAVNIARPCGRHTPRDATRSAGPDRLATKWRTSRVALPKKRKLAKTITIDIV
jgi:hypothetical protein